MGIRIHKALGWGLVNVKTKKAKYSKRINDPRFSENSVLTAGQDENYDQYTTKNYIQWLQDKKDKDLKNHHLSVELGWLKRLTAEEKISNLDFESSFIYNSEYGDSKIFCCVELVEIKKFIRFDDLIDIYGESNTYPINHVKILEEPIYPYLDFWNTLNGEKIPDEYSFPIRREINANKRKITHNLIEFSRQAGFDTPQNCIKHMKPKPPDCILRQLEFGNVFTSKDVFLQLQPMVYTYWS
jgi:hypothetical protein